MVRELVLYFATVARRGYNLINLLLDNIRMEIGYQGDVTTVPLKPHEAEEFEAIKNGLDVKGASFI